jgi:hypothetical protein
MYTGVLAQYISRPTCHDTTPGVDLARAFISDGSSIVANWRCKWLRDSRHGVLTADRENDRFARGSETENNMKSHVVAP